MNLLSALLASALIVAMGPHGGGGGDQGQPTKPATTTTTTKAQPATKAVPATRTMPATRAVPATGAVPATHAVRSTTHSSIKMAPPAAKVRANTNASSTGKIHSVGPKNTVRGNGSMKASVHANNATHVKAFTVHGNANAKANIHINEHITITPAVVTKLRGESTTQLVQIAKSHPAVQFVKVQKTVLQRIVTKRPALTNVTFVTGRVVSRGPKTIVIRESNGQVVPIVVNQTVVINQAALPPGAMVVLPTQFVNGQLVMVKAFDRDDEDEMASVPALAPCAINDGDGDDAGAVGQFAPAAACFQSDTDNDDFGSPFVALPPSFAPSSMLFSNNYAPVVASGFVVAQAGSQVVLMTPSFHTLVVNIAPAQQMGMVNGALSTGRYVTVYGYDVNNNLIATQLV